MGTVLYFSVLHGPQDPLHGPPVKNLCLKGSTRYKLNELK